MRPTASLDRRETDSGIEIKPVYDTDDAPHPLELPGEFPFTRGPYRDMYRGRPWTIRQYAGFASAEETNARFRYLLSRGQHGLSVAFDLPTQLGYDSDDPHALGEVGRTGVTNPKAQALRFHAQTGGSTLTAQQAENNIVRVAIQALSAVAGGAQSLHTNSFDEALALPTEHAAKIALRTQQILAAEAGATETADPLGGSYFVEALTDELEAKAEEYLQRIDELGGAIAAIDQGFVQSEIEQAAFRYQQQIESGERVVVGVNAFREDELEPIELHRLDPEAERRQLERTARVRAERNAEDASAALTRVREAAQGTENLLPPMREALCIRCTIGEISNVLREEWGTYDAQRARP